MAAIHLVEEGEPSFTIEWPDVIAAQPEVVVLMSCGYGRERNIEMWRKTPLPPEWDALPAVKAGRVYAVDANAYFSRSGPRLAQGVALLATLCHPDRTIPIGAPYDFEVVPQFESAPGVSASATSESMPPQKCLAKKPIARALVPRTKSSRSSSAQANKRSPHCSKIPA